MDFSSFIQYFFIKIVLSTLLELTILTPFTTSTRGDIKIIIILNTNNKQLNNTLVLNYILHK